MARKALTDGLIDAAAREKDFHPKQPNGTTVITAWERRKNTLLNHAEAIEALERKTADLEELIKDIQSSPF